MTDKQQRVNDLRKILKNLSPEQKNQLQSRGIIVTIDGHQLSLYNTLFAYLQSDRPVTVVGGYQQWRKVGKQVCKGEHGITILFPAGPKIKDDDGNETIQAEHFYCATVFDISQVQDIEVPQSAELVAVTA